MESWPPLSCSADRAPRVVSSLPPLRYLCLKAHGFAGCHQERSAWIECNSARDLRDAFLNLSSITSFEIL